MVAGVVAQLDAEQAGALLDLSGGPGECAMAVLAGSRKLKDTGCDHAAALEAAKEIAAAHRGGGEALLFRSH